MVHIVVAAELLLRPVPLLVAAAHSFLILLVLLALRGIVKLDLLAHQLVALVVLYALQSLLRLAESQKSITFRNLRSRV